jgi:hypothetical protein
LNTGSRDPIVPVTSKLKRLLKISNLIARHRRCRVGAYLKKFKTLIENEPETGAVTAIKT